MALGGFSAARGTPSSRKHAGTRAARAVALQASKVDTVCIVGCSGAVGKDWWDGMGSKGWHGWQWRNLKKFWKHVFLLKFLLKISWELWGFFLACWGVFSYFKWSPRPLTLIPSPVVIFSFGWMISTSQSLKHLSLKRINAGFRCTSLWSSSPPSLSSDQQLHYHQQHLKNVGSIIVIAPKLSYEDS